MKHTPDHRVEVIDGKGYCLQCDMKEESAHIAESYDNQGKTYYVCSKCNQDVEFVTEHDGPDDSRYYGAFCDNHGFIAE